MNAVLLLDLPHVAETGAASIGLFRTELLFMVTPRFPRVPEQVALYRAVLDAVGERPVTFRTLDIGGDKVLPYMARPDEQNPALGLAGDPHRARPAGPAALAAPRPAAGGEAGATSASCSR